MTVKRAPGASFNGYLVSIRAIGPKSEQAMQAAFDEMRRIESLMSRYVPDSDVSRINEGAAASLSRSVKRHFTS